MTDKFEIEFDAEDFIKKLDITSKEAFEGAKKGMEDCVDELARISSEITPIDKGILQRAYSKAIDQVNGVLRGSVEYSVKEAQKNGKHYNYALWTHEGDYKPGKKTKKRPGTSGWSGKSYRAGNKYLERPAKGEREAFLEHIAKEIKKAID